MGHGRLAGGCPFFRKFPRGGGIHFFANSRGGVIHFFANFPQISDIYNRVAFRQCKPVSTDIPGENCKTHSFGNFEQFPASGMCQKLSWSGQYTNPYVVIVLSKCLE